MISPSFLKVAESKVLIADLAWQDEARKVEKSCVPFNIFKAFLIKFISNFFFINQALFLFKGDGEFLFKIMYL